MVVSEIVDSSVGTVVKKTIVKSGVGDVVGEAVSECVVSMVEGDDFGTSVSIHVGTVVS